MDGWIVMSLGVFFMLTGVGTYLWGRREESAYYLALTSRIDVREFLEHSPFRPEPEALQIGGIICFVVGLTLFGMAFIWL